MEERMTLGGDWAWGTNPRRHGDLAGESCIIFYSFYFFYSFPFLHFYSCLFQFSCFFLRGVPVYGAYVMRVGHGVLFYLLFVYSSAFTSSVLAVLSSLPFFCFFFLSFPPHWII